MDKIYRPVRSQTLYWLSYPAEIWTVCEKVNEVWFKCLTQYLLRWTNVIQNRIIQTGPSENPLLPNLVR
jgi:hypothetical protein